MAFSERFGPMEPNINTYADEIKKDRIDSRVSDVSNLGEDNEILPAESRKRRSGLANRLWHTDSIFRHVPALTSLLYAHQVAPIGGRTEFADMRAAWDALPEAKRRRLEGLKVFHSIFHSRAKLGMTDYTERERASLPGAEQVLVRTIPQSGRKALYLASHAVRIVGMPDAESEALLSELMEFATAAAVRLHAPLARARPGDVGQPLHHAPRHRVRRAPLEARHAPRHGLGHRQHSVA